MHKKLLNPVNKSIKYVKQKPALSIGAGVTVLGIAILVAVGGGDGQYDSLIAQKRDVTKEVNITGQVQAVHDVDLAFEETGTISQVLVEIGDEVKTGQTLVALRSSDIAALLNQAEAQVDVEKATLNNLTENTAQDLENSYNNALNTINNALTKAEDAVRSKAATLFTGSKNSGFDLAFDSCSEGVNDRAEDSKLAAELELDRWNKELKALELSHSNDSLDIALNNAEKHTVVIQRFVDNISAALQTSCATNDSSLDTARENMATAQSNIITSIDNINDLVQTIASNKISADISNEIAAQEAKVRGAVASADSYRAQLQKRIIRSPIDGVITRLDTSVGETVTLNTPIVSVISAAEFEIEANIPEVEIAKVHVGAVAKITLDAYGDDDFFNAHVVAIDPAETIVSGVSNYKTTLFFDNNDERIRSGMTANIRILIDERSSVIAVPKASIYETETGKTVKILEGNGRNARTVEVEVETGLIGSDGFVEILSGVDEGNRVLIYETE